MRAVVLSSLLVVLCICESSGQDLKQVRLDTDSGIRVIGFGDGRSLHEAGILPLFSFRVGETLYDTGMAEVTHTGDSVTAMMVNGLEISCRESDDFSHGWKALVTILNRTVTDTLEVWNIVPFGEDPGHVHITGLGRHRLSRTHLFRPGYKPVNVIVPDNAWELGFSAIKAGEMNICALSRRTGSNGIQVRRFENILLPGGSVTYTLWAESYQGAWQEGLRKVFQERLLYDLESFDNTLYERHDLKWMRRSYASHLLFAWDHQYFDSREQKNNLMEFLERGKEWYGGDDFIGIWPTWPSLGLDQRNQWDLFRDLPGGLQELKSIAGKCRAKGARFFICYNPWDEDTRSESHYSGMADLIRQITADGVVLDTRGSSSLELQRAADSVRSGVVMYSEGMAVPADMPGIVSGRVHNALYYPPLLNLNKLIKPDFAIFRVAEIAYEPIRREYATSFFNGYGTELNIFKPGRPDWIEDDYRFFGRTLMILRENSSNFVHYDYIPLVNTLHDSIYVNAWPSGDKTVYTIFSVIPEGFEGLLFPAEPADDHHWVDVWDHQEISLTESDGDFFVPVRTEAFHRSWLGTNNEGAVSAVIRFPIILSVKLTVDILDFSASAGDSIRIWAGDPRYGKKPAIFGTGLQKIRLGDHFGRFEGDFIIQVMKDGEILDERIVTIPHGTPRLVSRIDETPAARRVPKGMVRIPEGEFAWKTTNGDEFIGYPTVPYEGKISMNSFFMDKYPVTNRQFHEFLKSSGYTPDDTVNFLKHWVDGKPPTGMEEFPVVYIACEDARAYARWAGKRLPTELEWQYAAQTPDLRPWPWGSGNNIEREKQWVTNTLTVSRLKGLDDRYCNPGNGKAEPVGSHPEGANPYGLEDLVGSVWQLTNDEYDNGTNCFVIMKGGSYFNPGSSWWYVQGGPRELHYRQMLLRVSRGFERNATVGFRCVK